MIGQLATRLASPSLRLLARGIADVNREFQAVCRPTNFQKRMLVWSHLYKNLLEIPETISWIQMKKAQDMIRTRTNIFITVGGLVGLMGFVNYEQRVRKHGYTE